MKTLVCLIATCGVFLVAVGGAQAASPVYEFKTAPSTTQAGGHPDVNIYLWVGNRGTQGSLPQPSCNCQDPKTIAIELPTGLIGNPHAVPRCTAIEFASSQCSPDSQVGLLSVKIGNEIPGSGSGGGSGPVAFYNLVPHHEQAGLLGFSIPLFNSPIYIVITPRTESDYGLNAEAVNIPHFAPISVLDQLIWGVPASPAHTGDRQPIGCEPFFHVNCTGVPSNSPEEPFLTNPTTCGVPLTSEVTVTSYDEVVTHGETGYAATTGCDQLSFNPSMFAQPSNKATDSPSGLDVNLQVPQFTSPTVPSPSELRSNVLTLPPGLTLNASAADGKVACTDAEARFGSRAPAQCPENAKIGTLTLKSPALPGPVPGYIYIGEPKPGERFRLILVADGFNVHIKLSGVATPDPQTGQLVVSFDDLPQAPFSDLDLHFFGSERAVMATATHCGTYSVDSVFTPWDSLLAPQSSSQFFSLDSGPNGSACPGTIRPFGPSFDAGSVDKTAGGHSELLTHFSRPDGDQILDTVKVDLPTGVTATLAGVPYCSEAAISRAYDPDRSAIAERDEPSCPSASRVGSVVAGVGAGSYQFYAPGSVYLAGPYKGAPLSLLAVIPGLSGPYDLGNVVNRVALQVDRTDAHVTAISDPLPRIIEGVVLRTRSVLLRLDRPNFSLNPTNCSPFTLAATISGDQDTVAPFDRHYQVANCASLDFSPRLDLRLTGGVNRLGHPAIHAVFRTDAGHANPRRVSVTLPDGELLDNAHIRSICTKVAFAAGDCPQGSIVGRARAFTPLLDQPLEGRAYLRSSSNELPDLAVDLKGQVDFELVGEVDSVDGRLRTTFEDIPDVPVSKFVLDLQGGAKGLLINSKSLCGVKKQATVRMAGQNGKQLTIRPALNPSCGTTGRVKRGDQSRVLRSREAE